MNRRNGQDRIADGRARIHLDSELVKGLRRQEAAAVETLVARYGDRAYRLATRITGSEHDAEEVVQDALWTVVSKIDAFRGEAALGSWLYRIVANTAYQKLRLQRNRRADVSLDEVLPVIDEHARRATPDWSAHVDDPALQTELRAALTSAINELPLDYRTAVVLRDVEGVSNSEIGKILRISLATVKSRVHRARLLLRKRLEDFMISCAVTPETRRAS